MTEEAWIAAIRESPGDDSVRLVYADWLDEHGESDRAEFMRLQCQLEPIRRRYEDDRTDSLLSRESALLVEHQERWLAGLAEVLGQPIDHGDATFRRGFVEALALPVQWYLQHGEAIHRLFPLLRRVELYRVAGWGERLARFPIGGLLEELEIACWIRGEDGESIATSPYLRRLSKLHLWLGNVDDEGADESVCRALARCSDWPNLAELKLTAVGENPEEWMPAFSPLPGALGNRAVFVNPWRRPYVFSHRGSFASNFPGRLPNGEQVFLVWPPNRGIRPYSDQRKHVLMRFDPEGDPVGESEIDFPEDCVQERYSGFESEKEFRRRRGAILLESLGWQPGLIRVKSMRLGDWWLVGDYPSYDQNPMGHPDDPERNPEEDSLWGPGGLGGSMHSWIREEYFTFCGNGGDWWVNGRGVVCAT